MSYHLLTLQTTYYGFTERARRRALSTLERHKVTE